MSESASREDSVGLDRRSNPRYKFTEPIPATFALTPLTLTAFSEAGAQAEHKDRLVVGRQASLVISFPTGTLTLCARVVWSRYGRSRHTNDLRYITGFAIIQDATETTADILDRMVETHCLQFDADSLARRREAEQRRRLQKVAVTEEHAQVSEFESEHFRLVQLARRFFRNNPEEAARWVARGRHSIARRGQDTCNEEIYALFEFLERRVELRMVKLVCQLS